MDICKIYKISGYGLNYYGSTTESLKRRLARHLGHYKDYNDGKRTDKITVFEIFDKGDEYKIELIEHFLCDDKKTLLDRENYYITNNICVNKCVPNRTLEQIKERQMKYNELHKDKIRETARLWAEKDRREKGVKEKVVGFDEKKYQREYKREKRAKETEEQKELRLQKRREQYKNKEQTEEQKERARERARKQRENKVLENKV